MKHASLFSTVMAGFLMTLVVSTSVNAATYWVGSATSACQAASNRYTSLVIAMAFARSTPEADEIRLTNTVNYYGPVGETTIEDFHPGISGSLTISGGYADCNSAQSGRALFGNTLDHTFRIKTNNQSSTVVTLKNLEFADAQARAIHATGNVAVTLDNVWIHDNDGGVAAWNGAFVDGKVNTFIQYNGSSNWGGGMYCNGTDSQINFAGLMTDNTTTGNGGNLYVGPGCYTELLDGAVLEGPGTSQGGSEAQFGGGIYVANGAELFANGAAAQVTIRGHTASEYGGGIYITGGGRAVLRNTSFSGNGAGLQGAVIYAVDGGTSTAQLVMDRVANCVDLIRCSEMKGNYLFGNRSLIYVENSLVDIHRTVIEQSIGSSVVDDFANIVHVENGEVRLNSVNISRNQVNRVFSILFGGKVIATHTTVVDNTRRASLTSIERPYLSISIGTIYVQNSILVDSMGIDNRGGSVLGKCNLVDVVGDLPAGSYFVDTPDFVNKAAFDYRQQAQSPGVDMCLNDTFAFSSDLDLGNQFRPVNEATNASGQPGETGGKYDAGFWESYINVTADFFDLNVNLAGTGSGFVVSTNTAGIDCPPSCVETYDQGLLVQLQASAATGDAINWSGCDVAGGDQCAVTMNSDKNITATFTNDDVVFKDNFGGM